MENFVFEAKVMWSQVDANMHLRHSAYADFAAQARVELLESMGFNAEVMQKIRIGPILFREELIYYREVSPNDTIRVTCQLSKARKDGRRWSFLQQLFRSDGIKAADIHVDGAWMDIDKRKLATLDESWNTKFMDFPKTADFILE